jgi:L,D-peptidoglycan transpeptidase YkuD (ErfK/YbiS/YcfS/YnhG family)
MENKPKQIETSEEIMTRKEALMKAGKYAVFTAVGMMIMLSPKKSQADSATPENPGGRGY